VVEFYLKLRLILRIITYLTYICWEINNFVIKSDIFRRFFICKNILKKLSCYHDNYFRYFMSGKYNGFVSKARVSACMYFLVLCCFERYVLLNFKAAVAKTWTYHVLKIVFLESTFNRLSVEASPLHNQTVRGHKNQVFLAV
jgi:hypothetical protein